MIYCLIYLIEKADPESHKKDEELVIPGFLLKKLPLRKFHVWDAINKYKFEYKNLNINPYHFFIVFYELIIIQRQN